MGFKESINLYFLHQASRPYTAETRRSSFTDATVPATAASNGAQYIVQGFRGTRFGTPSDAIIVQFGTDGGSFIAGNNDASSIKLAA